MRLGLLGVLVASNASGLSASPRTVSPVVYGQKLFTQYISMTWSAINFKVVKKTDEAAFIALNEAAVKAGMKVTRPNFGLAIGGRPLEAAQDKMTGEVILSEEIQSLFSAQGYLINRFGFTLSDHASLELLRDADSPFDSIKLDLSGLNTYGVNVEYLRPQLVELHKVLREIFTPQDISLLKAKAGGDVEIQKHYEIREAEISRLESMVARATSEVTSEALRVRNSLEEEFRKRNETLLREVEEMRTSLAADNNQKRAELAEREAALQERLKEVDNKESRHARRRLRQDLKEELARRSEKFELTKGTRSLRTPINVFLLVLVFVFGLGFAAYSYIGIEELAALRAGQSIVTPSVIASSIKQLIFGAAFTGTAVFFIRWNTRWFQAHADEEFRQKRFHLDLDRASWVVEMAMEWKEGGTTEIPMELLNQLTANLFEEPVAKEELYHPAEQLASAILGASAETSVELPGGTKVRLDRKSMKELSKRQKGQ
ncbi:hypothetical protein [Stigmatella erecta]|nr:hypothetical protein [Stigmatella erecta]